MAPHLRSYSVPVVEFPYLCSACIAPLDSGNRQASGVPASADADLLSSCKGAARHVGHTNPATEGMRSFNRLGKPRLTNRDADGSNTGRYYDCTTLIAGAPPAEGVPYRLSGTINRAREQRFDGSVYRHERRYGSRPLSSVDRDVSSALYGTTTLGGTDGSGTAFALMGLEQRGKLGAPERIRTGSSKFSG